MLAIGLDAVSQVDRLANKVRSYRFALGQVGGNLLAIGLDAVSQVDRPANKFAPTGLRWVR